MSNFGDDWPSSRRRLPDRSAIEEELGAGGDYKVARRDLSTSSVRETGNEGHGPQAPPNGRVPLWQKLVIALLLLLVLAGLAAGGTVVYFVDRYSAGLPDVGQLQNNYAPPQVTRIYARDQSVLATLFSERRTVVPFSRVPDHVKSAFLAAEDARFFEHEGLNYLGMLRAMVVNLRSGSVKQGGSTITQQVVKNVLLDSERSYRRKIRETILAYRLEKTLSKEQILGMYINHIYLGHGRYGVEEAGRYYFGKHVEELDVAEAALLAGIVAAPERYSPRKDEKKALARRRYVLGQMLNKGFMTKKVYDAVLERPVRLAPLAEGKSDIAPEMVQHARRLLKEMVGDEARKGGYSVHTTIDPALQVAARAAVRKGLDDYLRRQKLKPPFTLRQRRLWGKLFEGTPRRYGIYTGTVLERDDKQGTIVVQVGDARGVVRLHEEERYNPTHILPSEFVGERAALRVQFVDDPRTQGEQELPRLRLELGPQAALVAVNPSTREVLAAVGSYEALPGGLDRSFQTKRQPGSTFKPLVYSRALATHEVTTATMFEFPRTDSVQVDGETMTRQVVERLSLRHGVATSDNRVAEEVFRRVGGKNAVQWAHAMGIESKLAPTESLMLGAYEVSVAEMAQAYTTFASGGVFQPIRFISRVESGAGLLRENKPVQGKRVMDAGAAYLMTHVLESVVKMGTARAAASLKRPLAGKTGTTNRAKDAWFVGYSTDLVVAVWVGFDDALPLGWGESGAKAALPIWMQFMKAAHEGKPATEFPRPAEVIDVLVDPETGLLARYEQVDAREEVFLRGTEPVETAPEHALDDALDPPPPPIPPPLDPDEEN